MGDEHDDGTIELGRLISLSHSIRNIAASALSVRLFGNSSERGRRSERISNALKIHLADLKKGSTVLELECETFADTLKGHQGDLFNSEILELLPEKTPLSLVIDSFQQAFDFNEENSQLDKPLLKRLSEFRRIFISDSEKISFSDSNATYNLVLRKNDFKRITYLEKSLPEPQEIVVNGIVEELKYSKLRVGIKTKDGLVNAVLSEELEPLDISKFWGKEVTIIGRLYMRPSGRTSFIYIERLFSPGQIDEYFSQVPKKMNVEQQIQFKLKNHRHKNNLGDIVGQWPGNESIDDIINDLD